MMTGNNKHTSLTYRQARQAGITLTEAILGVATLGAGLGVIAKIQSDNIDSIKQQATAQQMKILVGASKAFVRDYYSVLTQGCGSVAVPPTNPPCPTGSKDYQGTIVNMPNIFGATGVALNATLNIPADALYVGGYVDESQVEPDGIIGLPILRFRINSYGSLYNLSVTNVGAPPNTLGAGVAGNRLRMQLVTTGGKALTDTEGASIASKVGPEGGFRPSDKAGKTLGTDYQQQYADTNVVGAFGNWTVTAASMGAGAPSTGALAGMAYFGEGGVVADFLYRNAIPGQPEAQQMNANINANQFGLGNVAQIGGPNPGFTGGTNGSSPNVQITNTAPAAVTATFGNQPQPVNAGVATTVPPSAAAANNTDNASAALTADNTIRFGNPLGSLMAAATLGGSATRYDRGNANIQVNDVISRNLDAAGAVRGLQNVVAGDRDNTPANRGQRVSMNSGFDGTGGLMAVAPPNVAAAGDPYFEGRDNKNFARFTRTFSRQTTAGANVVGSGSDTMTDGNNQQRFLNQYGVTGGSATTGELRVIDDTNHRRMDLAYTDPNTGSINYRDGSGAAPGVIRMGGSYTATTGDTYIRDQANQNRFISLYDSAAGTGRTTLADQTNAERTRTEYTTATDGQINLRQQNGTIRYQEFYGDAATGGRSDMTDTNAIRRYRNTYNNTSGSETLTDQASVARFQNSYNGATSLMIQRDDASIMRFQSNVGNATAGDVTTRDGAGRDRSINSYNATQTFFALNDGNATRKVDLVSGTTAQGAALGLNQQNGTQKVIAYAGDNAAGSGMNLRDQAGTDRVVLFSGTNAVGNSGLVQVRDNAGNQTALLAGATSNGAYLELGNAANTDQTYIQRTEGAFDQTALNVVVGDNIGTGVVNSDGNADTFNVSGAGSGPRLTVRSDGGVGINIGNPSARLDVNCNGGDPNCVLWRNNGNTTMNHLSNANGASGYTRLGSYAGAISSPNSGTWSVLDVDDIFLRGRNVWLSNALRYRLAGVYVVTNGDTVNPGIPAAECPFTIAVVSPNLWASPVMRQVSNSLGTDPGGQSYTAVRSYTSYGGGTSWQIFIEGRGVSPTRDSGWFGIPNSRATVQVYCYS